MKKRTHFCAFCSAPNRSYSQNKISFFMLTLFFLLAAGTSFMIRQKFDHFVLYVFFGALLCAEMLIKIRYRLSLRCKVCGFDPIVYKKNPLLACEDVKRVLQRRKMDPTTILKKPLILPKISQDRHDFWVNLEGKTAGNPPVEAKSGQLLSRQI